jgi:hypothetical protein
MVLSLLNVVNIRDGSRTGFFRLGSARLAEAGAEPVRVPAYSALKTYIFMHRNIDI